jgi:hypothetical protein
MIVLIHVLIALASMAYSTYVFFSPSQTKLRLSYGLVGATVASGTYLIVTNPAHMVQSCTTGLIYLGVVSVAIISARHKLAHETID